MTHHRFLAVHTLKVKGLASAEDLAEATGVSDLAPVLDALVAEELVKLRTGRVGGYTLTRAGREAHLDLLATEVDDAERAAAEQAYAAFLPINARFKEVCTRWQTVTPRRSRVR
jgi:DNA-binding IscR family transcriptional regulator